MGKIKIIKCYKPKEPKCIWCIVQIEKERQLVKYIMQDNPGTPPEEVLNQMIGDVIDASEDIEITLKNIKGE